MNRQHGDQGAWGQKNPARMAFGYIDGDMLVLYTFRRDLGYGKGKRGNWWVLRAFDAIADMREELHYPLTKWTFRLEIKLGVERILNRRNADFELMSKEDCIQRISDVMKAEDEEKRLRTQEFSASQPT